MITSEDQAREFCRHWCDETTMTALERFGAELSAENTRQNLIARPTVDRIWQRHIADSVQLLAHVPRETSGPLLDLGSGAGFPGLVLAIARPDLQIVLVESRKKRIEWLQRCSRELGLGNCRVSGSRLENVESFPASLITARAFAPLPKLLDLSARFSTQHTVWLLPKGRSAAQELKEQPNSVQKMFHVEQSLTEAEAQILVGKGIPTTR